MISAREGRESASDCECARECLSVCACLRVCFFCGREMKIKWE